MSTCGTTPVELTQPCACAPWQSCSSTNTGRFLECHSVLHYHLLAMIALDRLEAGLTGTQVHANKRGNVSARSWKTYPGGYPMIAERIASKPQTAIYRRFDALNARRILYLQAELCALEKQLHDIEEEDARKGLGYAFNYQRMVEANNGEGNVQAGLVKAMHKKLNEYSE